MHEAATLKASGARLWAIAKQTTEEYFDDDGLRLSASLAFYSVLSLAPILIFALTVGGIVWDTAPARAEVARYITEFAGGQAAEVVVTILESASGSGDAGFATIIGVVVLVFGATSAFAELQSGLNAVWKVEEINQVRAFLRKRLISAAIVFLLTIFLMLSVVAATVISFAASFIRTGSFLGEGLWFLVHHGAFLGAFTLLFATMFKLLPRTSTPWRRVWSGALFTSVLFWTGKYIIRLYLEQASLESSYGAAGSVIALLLWIYYSAVIFYLGAELTSVLVRRHEEEARTADSEAGSTPA